MRTVIISILSLLLLASCGEKKGGQSRSKAAGKLHGLWISDDYLQSVEKTKSPYGARDYSTRLLGLMLDSANLCKPDSAYLFGFTEHEGGYDSPLRFDAKEECFVNDTSRLTRYAAFREPFTLKLDAQNRLQMCCFPQLPKADVYRRVGSIDEWLRSCLFSGVYRNVENNAEVVFGDDGQLAGFDTLRHYYVIYDFIIDFNFDAICLQPNSSSRYMDWQFMHYAINADTLRLYKIHGDMDEYYFELGELVYTLVRK